MVLLVILIAAVIVIALVLAARLERRDVTVAGANGAPSDRAASSRGGAAPESPPAVAFHGCPPEGDGGDRALNRLKNRTEPSALLDTPFDSVLRLPIPPEANGGYRVRWPKRVATAVSTIERRAVRVEGYVARASLSGPESTNCHGDDPTDRDFHIWLTPAPTEVRTGSVIVEMSPRGRAVHGGWDLAHLRDVSRRHDRVRVGGWLMLDQEHPEQIGRTRGTIWEIHPVTSFEVFRGGRWVALDDVAVTRGRR